MKRILIALLLCAMIATPCLAEETPSAKDDFLANLSATWDSLMRMGQEAVESANNWINNDLVNWLNNELPAWADSASKSIQTWLDDAGQWTQEAGTKLEAFIKENGPAVEAWLNQAGTDVQNAWKALTDPNAHTSEELQAAYNTVVEKLEETQLANPWTELTQAELQQKSGVVLGVPEGAKVLACRWLESEKLAEMQFTLDSDEYCARVQPVALKEGELQNISGMYFAWENEEAVSISNCYGTIALAKTGSQDWVELCQWYDATAGNMYSLSVYTTDPDGLDLTAVAQMVFNPAK